MQKKIRNKNKTNEENDSLENKLWKARPKNKENKSQKSTAANSSIKSSEDSNNMEIESNISSKNNDAKIIKMEQMNLDQKNEKDDFFEDKKDSNEMKGEQYDLMECESEDEKMVNEENNEQRNDMPENEKVNETPIDIKEIPNKNNKEIINLEPKGGNIGNNINNTNNNIRPENTSKKNPIFKITRYKQKNNNTLCGNKNNTVISDLNFNESLFQEAQANNNNIDDDERIQFDEINVDSNRPLLNRGLSEALFANAPNVINNNTFGGNNAFYNAFDNYCDGKTCCKTKFK